MKKLILFVFTISFFSFNSYSENLFTDLEIKLANEQNNQQKVCEYKKILNEIPPCTNLELLKETLDNPYIKYLPRPENINIEELTHITRKYLIFTGATVIDCGIICYIFNVPAKIQGYCIIGIIIIGILLLAIRSKQFENHN